MAEPKPLASLSAGLLARKGAARPAMRRQTQTPGFGSADDLGWNDMGYDVGPQDHAADIGRMAGSALSPMGHRADVPTAEHDHAVPERDAMEAFGAAVDQAMPDSPVVQPMRDAVALPTEAAAPAVHHQQDRIERELLREAPPAAPAVAPAPAAAPARSRGKAPSGRVRAGTRGSFAFTLRLDPPRHLRLRLASALTNRSAQQIMIQLVDDYFASQPEIDAVAERLPASKRAV